jgi:leucyl/phenylalanyl-tRNA--protein transferase
MTQPPDNTDFPEFPDTALAMTDPNGLLASGGTLSVNWLLAAYHRGIFPWFNEEDPILWWSPDPRMVLSRTGVRLNRTFKRQLRNSPLTHITFDQCFERVIARCADSRDDEGTWITEDLMAAYCDAHHAGLAHSVEVWEGDTLIGGMYGIAMGDVFFGESMFSDKQSASRYALLALFAGHPHVTLIDCQVPSDHLLAFGAHLIPRLAFESLLRDHTPAVLAEVLADAKSWNWQQSISKDQLIQQVLAT